MNSIKYSLELIDGNDLKRICDLFARHAEIMKILNEDSKDSTSGGAIMNYEVEIILKEVWS